MYFVMIVSVNGCDVNFTNEPTEVTIEHVSKLLSEWYVQWETNDLIDDDEVWGYWEKIDTVKPFEEYQIREKGLKFFWEDNGKIVLEKKVNYGWDDMWEAVEWFRGLQQMLDFIELWKYK